MTEILSAPGSPDPSVLAGILDQLERRGVPRPPWLAVDDGRQAWLRQVVARPVQERRRGIIAASSDRTLIDAVRLEIGGGVRLPASTPGVESACEAAAAAGYRLAPSFAGDDVLEAVASVAAELRLVVWCPRGLWRRQLGRRLVDRLASVAERLRCAPAILPWPALLVADRSAAEIESAWRETTDDGGAAVPGPPRVADVSDAIGRAQPAVLIAQVLAEMDRGGDLDIHERFTGQPVHELPSGRLVGWWLAGPEGESPGPGWSAAPCEPTDIGHVWQLRAGRADWETVVDTASPDDERSRAKPVLRVPGWIAAGAGRGTPSGLLVERMALDGRRGGRPLWAPNVDLEEVQFLLGLPGPIWVDGPGVPQPRD